MLIAGLLLALGAAAPAGADPQADARAVLTAYFAAVKAGDWGTVYDLVSQESRGGQSREEFARTRQSGLGAELGKVIQERASYAVGALQVAADGKSAEAEVRMRVPDLSSDPGVIPTPERVSHAPLRDQQRTLQLVLEGGSWKVVRPKARLSSDAMERLQKAREEDERARRAGEPK
jgi:hypothetical protein